MTGLSSYRLSAIAESDVSEIFDYTLETHGRGQAAEYLTGLEETLSALMRRPGLGRVRAEIRAGLCSFLYRRHVIFYRVMEDHLRIVRILHARRDLPASLKDA